MSVLAGVHEQYQAADDQTTPLETLQRYPLAVITREFQNPLTPQNLIPKFESKCRSVVDADLIATFSLKLSVREVLSGAWRPFVQQLAAYIRDQGITDNVILVIWHEPENDVPKYFANAEAFVAYFNKVHDWVKGTNPSLLTCHAALGYRYADKNMGTSSSPDWQPIDISDDRARVWGGTKADIKAIDIYSGRSFPLGTILPELSGFKRWVTFTVGDGTYGVTERGWAADTAEERQLRAFTIRREGDWLRSTEIGRRCKVYIAWLTEGAEGDAGLLPDELMTEAVNYLLAKVNEPDPTPEPQPEPETITCPLCNGTAVVPKGAYTIVKAE